MKKLRKGLPLLSAFIMSVSMLGGACGDAIHVKAEGKESISSPRIAEDGTVTWDKVTFGSYYQNAEFKDEAIKWRILDIDKDGNALLLADEALDCKQYNENGVEKTYNAEDGTNMDYSCTWETCTLRYWLNGIENYKEDNSAFINAAFSEAERDAIINTKVENKNNPGYNLSDDEERNTGEGGNDTEDKIYLLSAEEVSDVRYGFVDTGNFGDSKMRAAKPTDYTYINGMQVWNYPYDDSGNPDYWYGNCQWWLRTPGSYNENAMLVGFTGSSSECKVNFSGYSAVRPVLHVNLSHVKDAGTVNSDGNDTAGTNRTTYSIPSTEGGVTTWDCVYFGHYKQKAEFKKMPIEWRVLFVNGDDALVVADKALDCKPYNNENKQCTWETCTLRDWLNGTDNYASDDTSFINAAFTEEERKAIIETTVNNASGKGNSTTDKVYLLSFEEVTNTAYGFDVSYFNNGKWEKAKTRETKATDYARMAGAFRSDSSGYVGDGIWWLRSPGYIEVNKPWDAYSVSWEDNYGGYYVNDNEIAVRPVLHVDISSLFVNVSGEVSSESNITEENIVAQKKAAREKADEVSKLISAIETVTKDSKTAIDAARNAYSALLEDAKVLVTNYSVLTAAEEKYAEIEKNAKADEGKDDNSGKADKPADVQPAATTEQQTTEQQTTTETKVTAPAKAKLSSLKNKKAKSLTATWKRVKDAKGYEVQYALNKKFTKSKKSKTTTKLTLTVKKLKKGKTYYVRVRAYNTAADGSRVNGKWSAVKKVKLKK